LKLEGVVSLPCLSAASGSLVEPVTLAQTTRLLACSSESTGLTVLVDWVNDPVDAGITADGLVLGINEDDFVVLVGRILVDPVRVQDTQVGAAASNTLLSGRLE
jgi:archaeosine-15-forming tRNA-guanine transglycosylase